MVQYFPSKVGTYSVVQEIPFFYETRNFITVFAKARLLARP